MGHFYDTVLAPTGLSLCQYGILSALNKRGPALPSVQELAEEQVLDRSTLGQNLRPLERDGLISLLTDPRDRRVRLIALTKQGLAKYYEANQYWETAQERFEALFGEDEAEKLRSVLLSIAYNPELSKLRNFTPKQTFSVTKATAHKSPRARQTTLTDKGLRRPGTPPTGSSSV